MDNNNRKRYFQEFGIYKEVLFIIQLVLCLDLVLGWGYNILYSKWRRINHVLVDLLYDNILIKLGR